MSPSLLLLLRHVLALLLSAQLGPGALEVLVSVIVEVDASPPLAILTVNLGNLIKKLELIFYSSIHQLNNTSTTLISIQQ